MQILVEQIKILNKYQKQLNDVSDERFNIFRICGVNHYENTHSSILVELLKNDSSHNFGDKFLEAFLDTLRLHNIINEEYHFYLANVKVITEFSVNGLGRIDIFIKNDNQCIIIENKIYATDQFEQLRRYEQYGKNNFRENFLLLYLTLWGNEAAEHSGKDVDYKQISYSETIVTWLERCVQISARNPVVRETLIQYINHLNYLTNKNTNSKMNDEIIALLSKEDNIDALFTIGENFDSARNYMINKLFIPQLTQVCSELNLINESEEYDRVNTAWSSFIITNPQWSNFKIVFEFEAKGLRNLIAGINYKDSKVRNEDSFNTLKMKFSKNNENWVWSSFPVYGNWNKEAMKAIKNGEMANLFKIEMEKILSLTSGLNM